MSDKNVNYVSAKNQTLLEKLFEKLASKFYSKNFISYFKFCEGIMNCAGPEKISQCRFDQEHYECEFPWESGAEQGRTCLNQYLPLLYTECIPGCACRLGEVEQHGQCIHPRKRCINIAVWDK